MYKLPEDFDFELLSGCYLETICFGAQVTILNFKRPQHAPGIRAYTVSFAVEGGLAFNIGGHNGNRDFGDPYSSAALLNLILSDVSGVTVSEISNLKINFGTDGCLTIMSSDSDEFESCTIYLNNGEVVVI
ncbi:hypothetical protein [Pseudomonas entomophila]|uniref:hypothetical protein n=1 Tax=Pseudomonas entomophila TaxID=312306 RepID=UPI001F002309|nr:hypothetical protein [Pseudomonas entomophila]MCG8295300.1 hypothetical protein [Pseudomonas entomophila]